MKDESHSKLEKNLGWAVLILLLIGCLLVIWPFISALVWAAVLCFASWPLYERLLRWTGNRCVLVSWLMTLGLFILMLLPFLIIGSSLVDNIRALIGTVQGWVEKGPPEPPGWLGKIPLVGNQAVERWHTLANDSARLWAESRHLVELGGSLLLKAGLGLGRGLLGLTLSIFITFFLFRDGAVFADRLNRTVDRIGGERGRHLLTVAGDTIHGVVYGILGTGLVQAIIAGIGFWIAGVPGIGLLSLLTFFGFRHSSRRHYRCVASSGYLAFLPGFHGLGHLHAHLGSWYRESGELYKALAHQQGQPYAISVDLLRHHRRSCGIRPYRALFRANFAVGRLSRR